MAALGLSKIDMDPSTDEADVEEVVDNIGVTGKKWSIEKDQLLIHGWINYDTNLTVGTDQKRSSIWGKLAAYFNEHSPKGP